MIYGLNFNGTHIPVSLKGRFAEKVKRSAEYKTGWSDSASNWTLFTFAIEETKFKLQGVCNSKDELVIMVMNADNGHRKTFVTQPRKIAGETWYGVYCS